MPAASQTIRYEVRDRVAWVTLDRPEVMNALSLELRNAIGEAFLEVSADDEVLVAVLTGEGGRAFSTGIDLKEAALRDAQGAPLATALSGYEQLDRCRKPVIAAIDGWCLAGGLELALCCDIRVATEESQFGLPEPRWSLTPDYGLHNLSRIIPLGEALSIHLTGSRIPAKRAYEIGLIQSLVPDREALFAEANRIAGEIKLCAPLAVQAIKLIVKVGRQLPVDSSQRFAEPLKEFIGKTEDRLEGPRAFAEGRAPVWKMR